MQAQKQTPPNNELTFARADLHAGSSASPAIGIFVTDSLCLTSSETARYRTEPTRLTFDAAELRDWDSGLLTF